MTLGLSESCNHPSQFPDHIMQLCPKSADLLLKTIVNSIQVLGLYVLELEYLLRKQLPMA